MRLHRFYLSEKIGDRKEVAINSADFIHQVGRVFRLNVGDLIILFDGSGSDFISTIKNLSKSEIILEIVEIRPSEYMPSKRVFLFQSIIKKDKFEWVVEKAAELGITDIVPVLSERSEKKDLNLYRLNKIAIEASEQCHRGDVPVIHNPMKLDLAIRNNFDCNMVVMHMVGENLSLMRLNLAKSDIGVFIGPEGGWSPRELEMFHSANIPIYSLGKQVLRAETASVSTLSLLML